MPICTVNSLLFVFLYYEFRSEDCETTEHIILFHNHALHLFLLTLNTQPSDAVPVYELVLLKILAALGNVSGHVEKVHHGQAGWLLLITQRDTPTMRY